MHVTENVIFALCIKIFIIEILSHVVRKHLFIGGFIMSNNNQNNYQDNNQNKNNNQNNYQNSNQNSSKNNNKNENCR